MYGHNQGGAPVEPHNKGEVFPLEAKECDTVLFGKCASSAIKINGKEYLIFREDEELGVLEGAPEFTAVYGRVTDDLRSRPALHESRNTNC